MSLCLQEDEWHNSISPDRIATIEAIFGDPLQT